MSIDARQWIDGLPPVVAPQAAALLRLFEAVEADGNSAFQASAAGADRSPTLRTGNGAPNWQRQPRARQTRHLFVTTQEFPKWAEQLVTAPKAGRVTNDGAMLTQSRMSPIRMAAHDSAVLGERRAVTLSILMPVFNERATVERAIEAARSVDLPIGRRELVVVDDGSTDGTRELLSAMTWPDVVIVHHDRNLGKGAAIRTALGHATGEFAAIFDADLEYPAENLALVVQPLVSGDASVVFGTRAWASHTAYSFWYVVGNKAVTLAANILFNCFISDVMTGHKAMRTELFRALPLRERGFGIEPEIAARLLLAGEQIYEVPIRYRARTRAEGKKLTAVDGLRVLRTLIRCRIT